MIPLTLHIGTPKTASTSIQESLWLNRQGLDDLGIRFCYNLGNTNNIDLFLACLHHDEGGFGILENRGVVGQANRDLFRNDVIRRLSENSHSSKPYCRPLNLIASSEHMWFLWSAVHFRNLKAILSQANVSLKNIIVYLRPQAELLYSALSTMVRDGFCVDDINVQSLESHEFQYLHYYDRLSEWRKNFPDAALKVYLFNDHKKQILEHFYNVCSLPYEGIIEAPVMNESLSDMGIALLAELNRNFLAGMTRQVVVAFLHSDNIRTRLGKLIELHFAGKPTPTFEVFESINRLYEVENQILLDEYFPGRPYEALCPKTISSGHGLFKGVIKDSAARVAKVLLEGMQSSKAL